MKPFEEKIIKLEVKVLQLEEKCNDNEQYSRRYNVRIHGVKNPILAVSDAKEDCFKTVIEFCRNELDIEVKHEEIDRAHRVGKSNSDGVRALIVKFKSYESKRKIMINKRKLKGRKLYVNEDLTWMNQQLLKRVRDAIAGKAYVFTADGYILVKGKFDSPPVRIRRDSDLLRYNFE